jgi:uncharacterized protein (DUF302 family)
MIARRTALAASSAALFAGGLALANAARADGTKVPTSGVIKNKSAHGMAETIARLKADIAAKGIMFFAEIDQGKLASGAGVSIRPSVLLLFGNPPLGTQFLSANAESGLDWPVRMLVFQDASGQVWIAYTDFAWIARRYGIANRDPQFAMAAKVAASISSAAEK